MQILTVADTEITKKAGDAPFELSVSTSGDGAISFQSSDTSAACVGNTSQDRGIVTLVGPGTAEITVTASETERYCAASKAIRQNDTSGRQREHSPACLFLGIKFGLWKIKSEGII